MSKNEITFERSSQSKIKGFKDLNLFDSFIQTALDKYYFTQEIPKLDESGEKFHEYILNEESQIPDLIIYNKPFNKNDCYSGYYNFGFNKFPRTKFTLKAQKNEENKEDSKINNTNNNPNNEEAQINQEKKLNEEINENTTNTQEKDKKNDNDKIEQKEKEDNNSKKEEKEEEFPFANKDEINDDKILEELENK